MKRPSILFINRVYPPARGATGRVLHDLAQAFAKEGWHVTILTTGEQASIKRNNTLRVITVKAPTDPKGVFDYALILYRLYARARRMPRRHLLVTMTDPPMLALIGKWLAKRKNCKHIHWCQDLYPDLLPSIGVNYPKPIMRILEYLSKSALQSCDRIIAIGRCMASTLKQNGIDQQKISIIPNWPDAELCHPINTGKTIAKKSSTSIQAQEQAQNCSRPYNDLIKDGPKFRVLYAGNIGKAHPVNTILNAAEELGNEPDIEFVFVGDGTGYDNIAQERSKRGLNNIRLLPYQPANHLRELMESGDLHLVSMNDNAAGALVPCKLYSALAVSRPCVFIGPEHSEPAKIINDFGAGIVIKQGDSKHLAGSIRRYLKNSDSWFAAHNGAAKAGELFLPEESINAWIERAWSLVQNELSRPPHARKKNKGQRP